MLKKPKKTSLKRWICTKNNRRKGEISGRRKIHNQKHKRKTVERCLGHSRIHRYVGHMARCSGKRTKVAEEI